MGLTIRFTFDPPTPYHTLKFHINRGIKQKLFDREHSRSAMPALLAEMSAGIKMLTQIPENYSIVVLPSKLFAFSILQHLYSPGTLIYPVHPSVTVSPYIEITDSGLITKAILPGKFTTISHQLKSRYLICRDADPSSGYALKIPDLISLKISHPDIHLLLDLSSSFMNFPLDLENIDGYLFESGYVTGMQPAITILILRDPLFQSVQNNWKNNFYHLLPGREKDYPGIIVHRETDAVRLFVFKEICYDLIRRDPKIIRNETIYKSIILYEALEKSDHFKLLVPDQQDRSPNIITASMISSPEIILSIFAKKGILFDLIPRENEGYIARFSNFPVHSREQTEHLADTIAGMRFIQ
ncbi:MAG: hypothetical protein KFF73_13650 [Cyclobacteriaceae bacterium]|nr:hypothetical protein [Cyclobacteriaceae bacterium]